MHADHVHPQTPILVCACNIKGSKIYISSNSTRYHFWSEKWHPDSPKHCQLLIHNKIDSLIYYVFGPHGNFRFKNNSVFTLLYQVENWSHWQRLKFAFNHSFPSSTWNQGSPVLVNTSWTGLTSLSIFLHTPVFSSYCYAHSLYFVFSLIYFYYANMCCSGCINSSAHSHNPPL